MRFIDNIKFFTVITMSVSLMLILSGCGNKPSNKLVKEYILDANPRLVNGFTDIKVDFSVETIRENTVLVNYTVEGKAKEDRVKNSGMDARSDGNLGNIYLIYLEVVEKKGDLCKYKGELLMARYGKEWRGEGGGVVTSASINEVMRLGDISGLKRRYIVEGKDKQETYELTKKLIPDSSTYVEGLNPLVVQNKAAIEKYMVNKKVVDFCNANIKKLEEIFKKEQASNNQQKMEIIKKWQGFLNLDIKNFEEIAQSDLAKLKQTGLTDENIKGSGIQVDDDFAESIWKEKTKYKDEYKKLGVF